MSGNRPYHHGDLRTALVEEAFDDLRAGGAEAVSLRAVAAAVGVSPSAAYHHFSDKEGLLRAVGEEADRLFSSRLVEAAASVHGDDDASVVERFRLLGRTYIAFAAHEPALFRHLFGPLCAPGSEEALASASQGFAVLLETVDELARRSLLRSGVREGLEMLAWSSVHGFALLATEGFLPRHAADQLVSTLLAAVIADPQETPIRSTDPERA